MKLQKEELAAVASHILDAIKEKNKVKITKEDKARIASYLKAREKKQIELDKLNKEMVDSRKELLLSFGITQNYYGGVDQESLEKEVVKMKTKGVPTLDEIRKAVIMKSLFSNETELEKFIKELIAKY